MVTAGAAKNRAAGNGIGGFLGSIGHLIHLSGCGSWFGRWGFRASLVQKLRAGDNRFHQETKPITVCASLVCIRSTTGSSES